MSFVIDGLGPADQRFVTQLTPMILDTLHKAAGALQRGAGVAESGRWFGDTSKPRLTQLAADLSHMASVINLEQIRIGFRPLARRSGSVAVAFPPEAGWGKYTRLANARGQDFQMQLDTSWNVAPLLRTATEGDSMFQTLVHELSHLVIGTDDEQYGFDACLALARRAPARAQNNADSWGATSSRISGSATA
jgi:hypothetical protein